MLEKTFKIVGYNHEPCPLNHVLKMGCTLESTDGWAEAALASDKSQASECVVSSKGHCRSYGKSKKLPRNYFWQLYFDSPSQQLPLSPIFLKLIQMFLISIFCLVVLSFLLHCPSSTEIISGRDVVSAFTVMMNWGPKDSQLPQRLITSLKTASYCNSGKEANLYFFFFRWGKVLDIHKYECSSAVHLKYKKESLFAGCSLSKLSKAPGCIVATG